MKTPLQIEAANRWSTTAPRFEWRRSQAHLLELASHVDDARWHLCAPPGAGKTLIGLELARRVSRPTLVLAPTIAVRDQWRGATAMFGADPDTFTTSSVDHTAPLLSVTYQLLGNPGAASDALRAAARRLWIADLRTERDDAVERIESIEINDPVAARRELHARVRRIRRSLHDGSDLGVARAELIGDRIERLLAQLVEREIGCVVLDECHHLLDWWALVITELVARLAASDEIAVIGLTATLPDPDNDREAHNYDALLGPVDAELHIPALVAEGAIASWCDGALLVEPTPEEVAFLDDIDAHLTRDLDTYLVSDEFVEWAVHALLGPALDDRLSAHDRLSSSELPHWQHFWDRDPLTAAALSGWWGQRDMALPVGFDAPGVGSGYDVDARLRLIDAWFTDPEHPCPAHLREAVRKLAERYGIAFTSAGPQPTRGVADIVAARSSAKGDGAAAVVAFERAMRGPSTRALVVVERDQATSPPAAARRVLAEDAGTTPRTIAALVADPAVVEGGVAAVTGRGAWVDGAHADATVLELSVMLGPTRSVEMRGTEIQGVVELIGTGQSWSSATWLDAFRHLLTEGVVATLVGTRALVGEGWDCPALNVVVDCSEASTATAVVQLRGRALRLDPNDPAKRASLWDVTVVHPAARREWARLARKHRRWWGPDRQGGITTGVEKVDERLGADDPPATTEQLAAINETVSASMRGGAWADATWGAVDSGGGGRPSLTVRRQPRARTRVPLRPRRWRMWRAGAGAATTAAAGSAAAALVLAAPWSWVPTGLAVLGAAGLAFTSRARMRDEDETILALGEAVRDGLAASIEPALAGCEVRIRSIDTTGPSLVLEIAAPEDRAERWADAVTEALGPLGTPRWMVAIDATLAWRVPTVIGATKDGAQRFADAFGARVPAARLVRAGTPEATEIVLEQARIRPNPVLRRARWVS